MRLLIFGATGQTGKQLIIQGLQQGHTITVFARNPSALQIKNKRLIIFQGDISKREQVIHAIKKQDAVISVLGNKTSNALWKANTVISDGLKNIIQGMKVNKVKRLLFVTSFGVSKNVFLPEKLLIKIFLKNIFADIPLQENMIKDSGLDYTIVRPARLVNSPKIGKYKEGIDLPIGLFSKIARSDIADFLLRNIENEKVIKKTITLSY